VKETGPEREKRHVLQFVAPVDISLKLQKLSMLSEQILQNCLIFIIVFASIQGHGFILFIKFTLLLTQKNCYNQ